MSNATGSVLETGDVDNQVDGCAGMGIAVSQLLFLYMDVRTMLAGDEGAMNYVDLVVNVVLGFGALYFISQDRKARAAA